ncbi:calcium/sodium antiporter [Saccharospirillum sp. HFRX-1]|uniref:calcium/sodium antiporter n=1 Tax=unclassified Saccharospirillum TaxID=2633430 RepID=UPI003720D6AC
MWLPALVLLAGLVVLVWSADRFVDGAAALAKHLGMSSLMIGMVIIGFGTSAPELMVSAFSAWTGNPGLALGNAYGSNITNIALVVGVTALVLPIQSQRSIARRELPILLGITLLAGWQLLDGYLSRLDAALLLLVFVLLMAYSIWRGSNEPAEEMADEVNALPLWRALVDLSLGLALLLISSRALVWGAVEVAQALGVSELIIGLTVVAFGTSLPELASALAAVRKREHDLAIGNVLGSGLFNTLAVVGIAAAVHPLTVATELLHRDWLVMLAVTLLLWALVWRGLIGRLAGVLLLFIYLAYIAWVSLPLLA